MKKNDWVWGYTMKKVPSAPSFYYGGASHCSLETAVSYLGLKKAVYLNSAESQDAICDEDFCYLNDCEEVVMALTHLEYAESAKKIAEFSLTHPNVKGVIIDDFLEEHGPSKDMTPEDLKNVYEGMKAINPDLKFWVVRYSRHPIHQVDPYLPYIDGIIFWVWISTDHYWRYQYENDTWELKQMGKDVVQGVFLHNYGEDYLKPMPMELLKLQMDMIGRAIERREIDGFCFLQNGWMSRADHREQTQFVKEYTDWFYGTHTDRRG